MAKSGIKTAEKVGFGFVEKNSKVFVSVKEEPFIILDDDDQNLDGREWAEPRPMEGLREYGSPPFLRKTFEMVDDPETNSIISWSFGKDSFIVWDPDKFCTHLLPKYFKHNNFSSFVRQLNAYLFRKINPERWEFSNEGFQQGKKHLLKHISRRNHTSQSLQQKQTALSSLDSTEHGTFHDFIFDCGVIIPQLLEVLMTESEIQPLLGSLLQETTFEMNSLDIF